MEKNEDAVKIKPRKLGDQWENWNGEIELNAGNVETNASVFLFLIVLTNTIFIIIGITLYFLIGNKYFVAHEIKYFFVNLAVLSIILINLSYTVLLLLTIYFKKPFAFFLNDKKITDLVSAKIAFSIGKNLIHQDKLLNSMLNLNNDLTKIVNRKLKKEELLIIVPRCLSKKTKVDLDNVMNNYNLKIHVATGGNQARQILKENKPKGIIAVACERDLYAGVKDVPSQIPVIAIANKRPEGPCINTLVNDDEIKEAIEFFLNK